MIFDRLLLWRDPHPRPGPENMAVDGWLLDTITQPILRIYGWEGDWVSLGYFGVMRDLRSKIRDEAVGLVRRATGGGVVDHRIDRTYTLVVPRGHPLGGMRGDESYRVVHTALAAAMHSVGIAAELIDCDGIGDSVACFEKAVAWDIVDPRGKKLAGAGQRRTRKGLLHQGSVVITGKSAGLFQSLAGHLASEIETIRREPSREELAAGIEKFEGRNWLERR